ncbi:MAG: hypothetical protein ACXW2U_00230 [Telluria sp.]
MLQAAPFPIRVECPPGACVCDRDSLLADPQADMRVLRLTREEEKKLIARIEDIATYDELKRIGERMRELLGIGLSIVPSTRGVRTVRGFTIRLEERPGLCRKTRESIPAAVRKCLERHPDIAYAILDAHDLLGGP